MSKFGNKLNWRGTSEERFWKYTNKKGVNDCWEWIKYKDKDGYGNFLVNQYPYKTHRFSYELHYGKIKKGLIVCHTCDNPCCVNPKHLFLGTHKTNAEDRVKKGRNGDISGENHYMGKLNWDKVRKIRELYSSGEYSQNKLADMFNVTQTAISKVILNKYWIEK